MNTTSFNSQLSKPNKEPIVSWLLCANILNQDLKKAIESCFQQSFSEFELIFIANGPNAFTISEAVNHWFGNDVRLRVFYTHVQHLSFSLSLGLHHARSSLIARMDSDDISYFDRLKHQVEYMSQHPEVAVVGTAFDIIDGLGSVQRTVVNPLSDVSIRSSLLRGNPLCHPSVMFRRSIVLEAGGYLGGLNAEDYDLWSRLSLNSQIRFANLQQVCLGYRVVGVGTARRSRWAYASVTASQFRNFLVGGGVKWLIAALISLCKLLIRSKSITQK